jgi:hypothetical protein
LALLVGLCGAAVQLTRRNRVVAAEAEADAYPAEPATAPERETEQV